jgi:hypothetical protein
MATKSIVTRHQAAKRRSRAQSCCCRDYKHCGPAIDLQFRWKATGRSARYCSPRQPPCVHATASHYRTGASPKDRAKNPLGPAMVRRQSRAAPRRAQTRSLPTHGTSPLKSAPEIGQRDCYVIADGEATPARCQVVRGAKLAVSYAAN